MSSDRNKPCSCGSGKKTKHCPGPHLADYEDAHRENFNRDFARRAAAQVGRGHRRASGGLLVLSTIAAMLAAPRGSR